MQTVLKINSEDNVAVALRILEKDECIEIEGTQVKVSETIKQGHKIALENINEKQHVIKYGHPIGVATKSISAGSLVHSHNIKTGLGEILEYTYEPKEIASPPKCEDTFKGYVREDGKVGIRNEIWILPTVGCVNNIAKSIEKEYAFKKIEGIDGVYAFPHPYGCSQLGEDHENTANILAALAKHPNAAGVLILGLGCENNRIETFKARLGDYSENRIKFLEAQQVEDEYEEALTYIEELIENNKRHTREDVDLSKLVIGLKCGGSDGYSGITANPMLGRFTDKIVGAGGSMILTEVPEMFGAETLLMERCQNEALFDKTVDMINRYKDYFQSNNQPIYENPSPGNKDGGITTLEEKSLGCVQKSGSVVVEGVLDYAQVLTTKGLNLLYGPGNDLVSTTAMAASGAQLILFTTGRGTPFGAPVPTIKVSTNTKLYRHKGQWIDFNAGEIVEGKSMDEVTNEFYDLVKDVASGESCTKTEYNEAREMVIFKNGITL